MKKIVLEGVEVQFNDFSKQTQERLYLQSKEKFEKEAVKSQHSSIRKLVIMDEQTRSDTLDEIFKVETEIYGDMENIGILWKHPNFEKSDKKRRMFAASNNENIQMIVARDKESSSKFLNEMLRNEVEGKKNWHVIKAIWANSNFQMEKETLEVLAKSNDWHDRKMAAKAKESSSKFLNEMLRNELQGKHDSDVINAILDNPNFQMEEETLEVLAKLNDWHDREMAAKAKESSSKFLNEMLRNEVQGEQDSDVIEAILNNPNFQMEEETSRILAKSTDKKYRKMAAKAKCISNETLQEMYLVETDEEILDIIELNLLRRSNITTTTLTTIQKRQIFEVLKEIKVSKNRIPLVNYLKQIFEIIG